MIGKIAKAKQYAQEPERIQFSQFEASFQGENDTHTIHYDHGAWACDCHFFTDHGACSHTMAAERVLGASTHSQSAGDSGVSDQPAAH
jgi:hypothetical protein